ncbi:MAG: hypothetical protein U9O98_05045 [Asgard group archaeon]|nr:hypothetical protein [Asgard group archaeon]
MTPKRNSKRRRKKISKGVKENLTRIINELSIIIGRKGYPDDNGRKFVTHALKYADTHVAAIALHIPIVDEIWRESGAREAFLKIRRRRKIIRFLVYGSAVAFALIATAGIALGVYYIETWVRWVILAIGIAVIMLAAGNIPTHVIQPYIEEKDKTLSERMPEECQKIDDYITELLEIRGR